MNPTTYPLNLPERPDRATRVRDLSRRLDRLSPSRRDPEAYHREKSDLVAELRRLAADLRQERGR